jgi:hypothetical protein
MGLIIPLLAVLALGIGIAWMIGGEKGPEALGRAIRRGAAGALIASGAMMAATGRVPVGIVLIGIGLSMMKPKFLEQRSWFKDDTILRGRFAGRPLDTLNRTELIALYAEVAGKPVDRLRLEAYLDRRMPGWRENVDDDPASRTRRPASSGSMTEQQAYQILGLAPGATEAEISTTYRRLMKRVHPDQGGSTFLAAQINEAKERLLGRHR